MKQFWTIFKFELKGYFKNKIFVGITLFLVIAIGIATFLPNILSVTSNPSEEEEYRENYPVMLVKSEDGDITEFVKNCFSETFADYNVKMTEASADDIKDAILKEEVECAFIVRKTPENSISYEYLVNNLTLYDMNAQTAEETLISV